MQYRKTHVALLLIVGFFGCNPDSSEVVVSSDDCATNPSLYDYCLKDINPSSITYGKNIFRLDKYLCNLKVKNLNEYNYYFIYSKNSKT